MNNPWYRLTNEADVPSPALLVYPQRIRENIRRMVAQVGEVQRLRPHVKTHKLAEVVRMQMEAGITKFKCATIAEAEMLANTGAKDILLAYQPVGPNARRLAQLAGKFPDLKFLTIADDAGAIRALSQACVAADVEVEVLLDVDCGMHRTGIPAGAGAVVLYRLIQELPGLRPGGLHAYDGHNRIEGLAERMVAANQDMAPMRQLRNDLVAAGLPVPRVVAGGSPTFPVHAQAPDVECSPGTNVFWDAGYGGRFPDMDFLPAALVLTRVVSKPGGNLLCLDLGHKAIASEMPHPRVHFQGLGEVKAITHSEEHLVIETPRAGEFSVGAVLYGIPQHICPTVALHGQAVVVEEGKATDRWKIAARERSLTV